MTPRMRRSLLTDSTWQVQPTRTERRKLMTHMVLLATLFFAFPAWADEPDLSQIEARMQETKERLGFTEEQQAQLQPVLDDHFNAQMAILDKYGLDAGNRESGKQPDFKKIRELRKELDANTAKTTERLSGLLSEEQLAEFEKIQDERKKQIQEKFLSKQIKGIAAGLDLTKEQMAKVKPILDNHFAAQMAILDKHGINARQGDGKKRMGFRKMRALRNDMEENKTKTLELLSSVLSDEQLAKFEQMEAERKQQMREKFKSRR